MFPRFLLTVTTLLFAVTSAQDSAAFQDEQSAPVPFQPNPLLGGDDSIVSAPSDSRQSPVNVKGVLPEDLLPPPVDPQRLVGDVVRAGDFRGAFIIPGTEISLRIGGYARVDAIYDTGFVPTGALLFPGRIALDGTPLALRRGRTQFTGGQSRLSFDAQSNSEVGRVRGYVEFDFLENNRDPRTRHVYGEWENECHSIIGGHTWTTFMDGKALPQVVAETAVAGAVFRRQAQIRYTRNVSENLNWSAAVESPISTDFLSPAPLTDQRLERWPDFITRIRSQNDRSTWQVASIVRGLGFEDITGDERFQTGWGVSLTGRINISSTDSIVMGTTYGYGIAGYLAGFAGDTSAAVPDGPGLRALENFVSYVGYKHRWSEILKSNFYYGYADAENTGPLVTQVTRTVHNGGVNLVWNPRRNFGVGVEYNFIHRRSQSEATGDNHRLQFALQFGL